MIKNKIIFILLFLTVFFTSFYIRRVICSREVKKISNEISQRLGIDTDFAPFLVESSMMYSYAEMVADGSGIPEYDEQLTTLAEIPVNRQFSNALEYFLGYSYRIKVYLFGKGKFKQADLNFEDNPDFSHWVRLNIAVWAALVSGLIFLILYSFRMPVVFAFIGGMLHAVSPASVARYTGQDIVRGNFALPFLTASLLFYYLYYRKPGKLKFIMLIFAVFTAMSSWDMSQIVFSLWGIAEIIRLVAAERHQRGNILSKSLILWSGICAGILLSAVLVPYNREHILIFSPLTIIVFPLIFLLNFKQDRSVKFRFLLTLCALFLLVAVWKIGGALSGFSGNYSHFASLLYAKIKFLNIKPQDPRLLDFDARSVWVPAMHSADKFIYSNIFPVSMNIFAVMLILSLYIKTVRQVLVRYLPLLYLPLYMGILYSFLFFFIVRYHVFAIIFISLNLSVLFFIWKKSIPRLNSREIVSVITILIIYFVGYGVYYRLPASGHLTLKILFASFKLPVLALIFCGVLALSVFLFRKLQKKQSAVLPDILKFCLAGLIFITFITELDGTLASSRKYKTHFFPETAALIYWFRHEGNEDQIVMADFNLSPLLKNYCRSHIVLQPKFELGKTRELYYKFMTDMFHGTEKELAAFCEENGAEYFVYDRGYAVSEGIYSPMYMAGAVEVKKGTPAYDMNLLQDRENLKYFYEIKPPASLKFLSTRYIVFKVISEHDRKKSADFMVQAKKEYLQKNYKLAARLVKSAVFADPNNADAYLQYMEIYKKPPDITLKGF